MQNKNIREDARLRLGISNRNRINGKKTENKQKFVSDFPTMGHILKYRL
jgi:hypothetical protein